MAWGLDAVIEYKSLSAKFSTHCSAFEAPKCQGKGKLLGEIPLFDSPQLDQSIKFILKNILTQGYKLHPTKFHFTFK